MKYKIAYYQLNRKEIKMRYGIASQQGWIQGIDDSDIIITGDTTQALAYANQSGAKNALKRLHRDFPTIASNYHVRPINV